MGTAAFIVVTTVFLIVFALWTTWKEKKEGLTR
jgi:hypothetical protein